MANDNNAGILDDFDLEEPDEFSAQNVQVSAEPARFERPARPRKTAEPINDMSETGSVDAVYVSDSPYTGKGMADSSYRRSRSGMNQLRRDLHYGQYLEIPKGRRDIFASRERKNRVKSVLALIVVLALVFAAAWFAVKWFQENVPFMAAEWIVAIALSLL